MLIKIDFESTITDNDNQKNAEPVHLHSDRLQTNFFKTPKH